MPGRPRTSLSPQRVAVAEVSASAYYDWLFKVTTGPSDAEWDEALLVNEMFEIHYGHDDTYGCRRA